MTLFPISQPLQDEKLADVVPTIRPFVDDPDRLARLNFFPGRNLTDTAFQNEHQGWLRRLLLRGQAVSPGVIDGLEVGLNPTGVDAFLTLGAGSGLTLSGEDVMVDRKLVVKVGELRICDLATQAITGRMGALPVPAAKPTAGVLVWQPVSIPDDEIPAAAIPAGFDQSFIPCDRVPTDESYYRRNVIDGTRLVLCFWPVDWRPLPSFNGQWRNYLAWEIFKAEREGEFPPWLQVGLPVGLIGFDVKYQPLFVDRAAVVRQGGHPRFRSLRERAGEPRLWQAQVDQFAAYLGELSSSATAAVNFRYLPPVGLLPKVFIKLDKQPGPPAQWNIGQTFFLSTYLIEVTVASLEQLDAVFDAARDLEPYDLWQPDAVKLLLPVAQQFFDPRLLEIEKVSQEFLDTVNALTTARGVWRARREDLRAKDTALNMALTTKAPQFPAPDPGQLDADETAATTIPDPAEELYGTRAAGGKLTVDAIEEIRSVLGNYLKQFNQGDLAELKDPIASDYLKRQQSIQADENGALDRLGLRGFITYLTDKADRADSLIDRGFLKVNADVYRLGQLLTSNALGTQFAASSSLASTVVRQTGAATPGGVNLFASRLFSDLATADTRPTSTAGATTSAAAPGSAPPPGPSPVPFAAARTLAASVPLAAGSTVSLAAGSTAATTLFTGRVTSVAFNDFISAGEVLSTPDAQTQLKALEATVNTSKNNDAIAALANLQKASVAQPETLAQLKSLATFADAYVPNFNSVTPKQLRAIPFERLPAPAAPQVRGDLFTTKLEIFDKLMQLDISLAQLTTDFVDTPEPQVTEQPPAGTQTTQPPAARSTFHQVILMRSLDVMNPADADEARHFSRGVKHADMSIAALRAVEGRIKLYRDLITLCQDKLATIESNLKLLEGRMKIVDDSLDEARHDVAVAKALLAEEVARVNGINDHREKILREHVSFVVFHRPRAVEARDDTPTRVIEPALRVQPIPDCLAEDLTLPPDLASLAQVFRDSPARWFKYAPDWIGLVNRLDHLRDLMVRSVQRPATFTSGAPVASNGRYSAALTTVFTSRLNLSAGFVPAVQALNPASFTSLSWSELFRRAQQVLTLGHLIDTGPANVADVAAAELKNLFRVGACLHRDFSQVTPFLRLLWAERYSQFDGPADFRNLSILPRWNEVPFTLRREMQIDADWLYSRVDAQQPDALELIHDLIRVALLLASHAPVDQLITGALAEETTPSSGGLIKVRVDPYRVHVGMEVVVEQAGTVAGMRTALVHGVVEDIAAGQVSARVTNVPVASKLDPNLTTVRFQEPSLFSVR